MPYILYFLTQSLFLIHIQTIQTAFYNVIGVFNLTVIQM